MILSDVVGNHPINVKKGIELVRTISTRSSSVMRTGYSWYDGMTGGSVTMHMTRHGLPVVVDCLAGWVGQFSTHPQTVGQTARCTEVLSSRYVVAINDLSKTVRLIYEENRWKWWKVVDFKNWFCTALPTGANAKAKLHKMYNFQFILVVSMDETLLWKWTFFAHLNLYYGWPFQNIS